MLELSNDISYQSYRKSAPDSAAEQTKKSFGSYLLEEQAGFRKDRSTVHQILTLRLLAEKAKRQGKKIYNCFIDFQKAFDSIKHKIIQCRN